MLRIHIGHRDRLTQRQAQGAAGDDANFILAMEHLRILPSDLVSGVSGVVAEVNTALDDAPEQVNDDPFSAGWMIKLRVTDPSAVESLLTAEAYEAQLEGD